MSPWADAIYQQKYAHPGEIWPDTAHRVATHVMGALGYPEFAPEVQRIERLITERKFLPGGRYLYASGRDLHQTQNCFAGETRVLTDQGVRQLDEMVNESIRVRNR